MAQRNRLSIDYDNMVVPGLLGGKEPSFVGAELQADLDELKTIFNHEPLVCLGLDTVLGCGSYADRLHFLLPWIEMKKRGIPKYLRTHPSVVIPLCNNCYLLYDSKHRRLKTAWVKEAGLTIRKSPSYLRGKYDKACISLVKVTADSLRVATKFLDHQYNMSAHVQQFTINGTEFLAANSVVTNIDTSELKQRGKITIVSWSANKHLDLDKETAM